jgi:hypothetical protein
LKTRCAVAARLSIRNYMAGIEGVMVTRMTLDAGVIAIT